MAVFCGVYGGMEITYGSFILTFVVQCLGAEHESASLILTCYWGSLAAGRAVSIVTSKFVRADVMIALNLTSATLALIVLTFLCDYHLTISFVCSVVIGVSFAPVFGNTIAYCQQVLRISGRQTSLLVVSLYIGFICMPGIVGYLFTSFTPMLFLYILLVASLIASSLYVIIKVYERNVSQETANDTDVVHGDVKNPTHDLIKSIEMLASKSSIT